MSSASQSQGKEDKPSATDIVRKGDLFQSLRILLYFGRIIGILPISGLFQGSLTAVYIKYICVFKRDAKFCQFHFNK